MPQKTPVQLYALAALILLFMAGMIYRFYSVASGDQAVTAGIRQGKYHLSIPVSEGTIYDRSMNPMNNSEETILAVVSPTPDTIASIFTKLRDREAVSEQLQHVSPFVCELTADAEETPNLRILHGTASPAGALPAQHLLGYRQNGTGMAGLERAYAGWLSACDVTADITFTVSGRGEVLAGAESEMQCSGQQGGGVVTTLDAELQRMTEEVLQQAAPHAGAAVIMDCRTGELISCASTPVYDPQNLGEAMQDPQSPFVNRAFSAYSVGSIFKLVTASAALENGVSDRLMYQCEGSTEVYGQTFRCHQWNGHGLLNMQDALIASCNPYFISLSQILTADALHDTAAAFGFGTETVLAEGMSASAGYLPTVKELAIDAEKANFSFGQGKLSATPLQITAMTACIANGGIYHAPKLMLGVTADGNTLRPFDTAEGSRAISEETAEALRRMMQAVIYENEATNAKPANTTAAGKTSTAQTGQFAADGTEYCHAWMTGFFPAEAPRYAVTVLIENGGSGNQAAAPLFREIIERMTDMLSPAG
ncbi:MAG: penicillin-binding protein 2 [Oscillospiraceae bacterium]|nr:penicillin-binding protein 2 [Oscillospiraceae bacterium]